MLIEVTQDDINHGKPQEPSLCPVALAITRACRSESTVSRKEIHIYSNSRLRHYDVSFLAKIFQTPKLVVDFIKAFDHNQPVTPFTFELEE